jgi:drug/metabolite transporter (DMT)-like permease
VLYISILIVITGAVFYEIIEEMAPKRENHYLYLILTYVTALCFLLTYLIVTKYDFHNILKDLNYQSFLVGIAAMFADYGLIISYNNGWKISTLNITYSISTFLILLFVGTLFLNEHITIIKLLGVAICSVAILLINHKAKRRGGRR